MINETPGLDQTESKVVKWALDRKITINGNSVTQVAKLLEESGELAAGILKHRPEMIKDAIGDAMVVLSGIARLEGMTLAECYDHAYNEIKDRRGYLDTNGNFIKEADYIDNISHDNCHPGQKSFDFAKENSQ